MPWRSYKDRYKSAAIIRPPMRATALPLSMLAFSALQFYRYKDRVLSYLNDCSSEYSAISISVDDVSNGLKLVKLGKSCGVDGLSAQHFIYAGNYVKVYNIYLFYLLLLFHMVTPDGFMKSSAIIPLIKIKPETPTTKTTIGQLH